MGSKAIKGSAENKNAFYSATPAVNVVAAAGNFRLNGEITIERRIDRGQFRANVGKVSQKSCPFIKSIVARVSHTTGLIE